MMGTIINYFISWGIYCWFIILYSYQYTPFIKLRFPLQIRFMQQLMERNLQWDGHTIPREHHGHQSCPSVNVPTLSMVQY